LERHVEEFGEPRDHGNAREKAMCTFLKFNTGYPKKAWFVKGIAFEIWIILVSMLRLGGVDDLLSR